MTDEPYSRAPTKAEIEFLEQYGMVPSDAEGFAEMARIFTPGDRVRHPGHSVWFWTMLGLFHMCWHSADLLIDYAMSEFLGRPPEVTALITSGLVFGRKARLLGDLIQRSDHRNRAELLRCLNGIRGEIRRDVIAHSYIASEDDGRIHSSIKTTEGLLEAKFIASRSGSSVSTFVCSSIS